MSHSTIRLPNDLLEELMRSVQAKNKTEAVIMAIKNEIQLKRLEKIRSMAGKMEFVQTAEEIRHGEERLGPAEVSNRSKSSL